MSDAVEFDPAAVDRAIQHLRNVLALMDRHGVVVADLQRITQPGAAPSTQAFHALLGQSMARLRQQHEALRHNVESQIEELNRTKRTYGATDRAGAQAFKAIGEQL